MKHVPNNRRRSGFTSIDLMIVLGIVGIFLMGLQSILTSHHHYVRSKRINCISNLKQIGVAFRLFANDNDGHYPMTVSSSKGGAKEFTSAGETYRHFLAAGNEMSSPRILLCPLDVKSIVPRPDFSTNIVPFSNSNISYFVGLDADETRPQLLMTGDRNLTKRVMPKGPIMALTARSDVGWTKELHSTKSKEPCGNIGLADGSAQQVNNEKLRAVLGQSSNAVQRFMLP